MRLRFVEETGSTNADLLAREDATEGEWLVAARQTSGRGRQGREWQSQTGNYFGSTIVNLRSSDPEAASLALVAGLALIDAIELAAPEAAVSLKWPNDVMRGKGKLAGILLERNADRVVAGFGVNLAIAPDLDDRETASLADCENVTPENFAPLLAGTFDRMLNSWRMAEPSSLVRAWEAKAHPIGTRLTVHADVSDKMSGTYQGLDHDGALRLETDGGEIVIVRVGDVTFG